MSRSGIASRLRVALLAATAAVVVTAVPGGVAAAGVAPLIDGWRPAPHAHAVEVHAVYLVAAPGPDAARDGRGSRVRAQAARIAGSQAPAGGNPCTDSRYNLSRNRTHWSEPYRWWFQAGSTPSGITRDATERALTRAVSNITGADNDCGRSDRVSASAIYLGRTDRRPGITKDGGCRLQDGVSVVGFGPLPSGIAGLACVVSSGDRIIETDIKLNRSQRWATALANCSFASMVEAVATHEFGHAFGLGHVSEATHGRLTMSKTLDGYCQLNEATLGKGDMLGLEEIY